MSHAKEPTVSDRRSVAMKDEPDPDAAFDLEGPDECGDVWVSSQDGSNVWRRKLGPADKVADKFINWLKTKWLRIGKAGSAGKPGPPKP